TTDADGIVTVVIDEPGAKVNTMNDYYSAAMQATVEWLEANVDDITGVVLTSPKKTFFAGGNLNQIRQASPETAEDRKSTRLNSSHVSISYAVFCLKKK